MGLLRLISIDPVVRLPVLVGYREDKNMVFFYGIQQLIWKRVQEALPYFTPLYGSGLRVLSNSYCSLSHFLLESLSEPCRFEIIEADSIFQLLRRYSSEYDAHHLSLNTSSIGTPWSFPAR